MSPPTAGPGATAIPNTGARERQGKRVRRRLGEVVRPRDGTDHRARPRLAVQARKRRSSVGCGRHRPTPQRRRAGGGRHRGWRDRLGRGALVEPPHHRPDRSQRAVWRAHVPHRQPDRDAANRFVQWRRRLRRAGSRLYPDQLGPGVAARPLLPRPAQRFALAGWLRRRGGDCGGVPGPADRLVLRL